MAIAFRSAAGDNFSATASPVTTYPAGVVADDILLTFFVSDTSHDTSGAPPAGWTKIYEVDRGTDSSGSAFWKRAVGSESGTLTWTNIFAVGESGRAVMLAYSGCITSGSAIDANTGTDGSAGASTRKDTPTVTPAAADCMAIGCIGGDLVVDPALFTWDAGITERIDGNTSPSGQNGLLGGSTIAEKQLSGKPATSLGGDYTTGAEAGFKAIFFLVPPGAPQDPADLLMMLGVGMERG